MVASTLKRGGRPKAGEAEQRNERLVRTAGEMFMQFGFDGTSMEAVARAARISKRTLYGRYVDKAALFSEVVRDLVRRWLVPIAQIESEQDKLDDVLLALARYLTTFSLTPKSVSVNRVVIFESRQSTRKLGSWPKTPAESLPSPRSRQFCRGAGANFT